MKLFVKLKNLLVKSDYEKNIAVLSVGAVFARGIAVLTTPILSRIYDPNVFGDFAVLSSGYKIIGTVSTLGMMTLIMVAQNDEEAKGVCRTLLKAALVISAVSGTLLVVLQTEFSFFSLSVPYSLGCVFILLLVISDTLLNVSYAYANRLKKYRIIVYAPVVNAAVTAATSLLFGYLNLKTAGYATAVILASVSEAIFILLFANPFLGVLESKYSFAHILRRNRVFPRVQLPANLIGTLSDQLPITLICGLFGNMLLGFYTMCQKVLLLPINLIAMPFNRVYLQEASEKVNRNEDIGPFSFQITKACARLVLIPILLLIVCGQALFPIAFGNAWLEAGQLISAVAVAGVADILDNCLSNRFVLINRHLYGFIFSGIRLAVSISALYISWRIWHDYYWTLLLFSVCKSVVTFADITLYFHKIGIKKRKTVSFNLFYFILPTVLAVLLKRFHRI